MAVADDFARAKISIFPGKLGQCGIHNLLNKKKRLKKKKKKKYCRNTFWAQCSKYNLLQLFHLGQSNIHNLQQKFLLGNRVVFTIYVKTVWGRRCIHNLQQKLLLGRQFCFRILRTVRCTQYQTNKQNDTDKKIYKIKIKN